MNIRLDGSENLYEIIIKLSEGNPGAATVCSSLIKNQKKYRSR